MSQGDDASAAAGRLGHGRSRSRRGLGAASSSCSYAAVALARSLFRKGADFTAAMAFEFASTNLVIELGIILAVLMGWQFTLARVRRRPDHDRAPRAALPAHPAPAAHGRGARQADRGLAGSMEGHAAMDMSVARGARSGGCSSAEGFTAISHYFVMDWAAIWMDIVARPADRRGARGVGARRRSGRRSSSSDHPLRAKLWGPLIGPLVAMLSFVCSIGNVPLAAVLWNGGISFGGVVAFIFADLIILPILNIYRKYYGRRMALFLLGDLLRDDGRGRVVVELLFGGARARARRAQRQRDGGEHHLELHDRPQHRLPRARGALVVRFLRTGGPAMLRMMGGTPTAHEANEPASDGAQISAGRRDGPGEFSCPMYPEVTSDASGTCPRSAECHCRAHDPGTRGVLRGQGVSVLNTPAAGRWA